MDQNSYHVSIKGYIDSVTQNDHSPRYSGDFLPNHNGEKHAWACFPSKKRVGFPVCVPCFTPSTPAQMPLVVLASSLFPFQKTAVEGSLYIYIYMKQNLYYGDLIGPPNVGFTSFANNIQTEHVGRLEQ